MSFSLFSCPSCGSPMDRTAFSCPECEYQASGETALRETIAPATKQPMPVSANLAILIDITASSNAFSEGIALGQQMILKSVEVEVSEVLVSVQTHGDQDEGQLPTFVLEQGTVDEAIDEFDGLKFYGGGEPQEHHLSAIEHALDKAPWNADRRIGPDLMVCYMNAGSKPAHSGRAPAEIGHAIKKAGIMLFMIATRESEITELTEAANGIFIEISNTPSEEEMQEISQLLSASIPQSIITGSTMPLMHAPDDIDSTDQNQ